MLRIVNLSLIFLQVRVKQVQLEEDSGELDKMSQETQGAGRQFEI